MNKKLKNAIIVTAAALVAAVGIVAATGIGARKVSAMTEEEAKAMAATMVSADAKLVSTDSDDDRITFTFVDEKTGEVKDITVDLNRGAIVNEKNRVDDKTDFDKKDGKTDFDKKDDKSDYNKKDDTDYGPNNDGVTDYDDTDYGPNNDGVTDYKDDSDYTKATTTKKVVKADTDYDDDSDYKAPAPKPTTKKTAAPKPAPKPTTRPAPVKVNSDYDNSDYDNSDYDNSDYDD